LRLPSHFLSITTRDQQQL